MGPIAWLRSLAGSEIPTAADPYGAHPASSPPLHPVGLAGTEVLRRALSMVGRGTYRLGRGGRRPHDPQPFDAAGLCDCSGFAAWCLGVDRYQPDGIDGEWISTDSIVRDARGPHRMFVEVPISDALPGDLVVYPGTYLRGRRVRIGHVGVIIGPGATIAATRVAHCASSGPVAVRVSDGRPWDRRGIVVRRAG